MKIPINSKGKIPETANWGDAGVDLSYCGNETIFLHPGKRCLVPTGLRINLPDGYELQIRPRSGLAIKYGITVLNAPGTIDSGYLGEIKVILINHGEEVFEINSGDRIAQAVLAKYENISWLSVTDNEFNQLESERGTGGFGHTGK